MTITQHIDTPQGRRIAYHKSGSKGPTSKDGKLTPKGAALKRWNC